ncbi:MAG: NAD(P)-dependent oxidoreductase [Thermomicrobiales bacterium]|nr:NAD(P)-dependent oxidoreductase [Thermomicrobiales bacterium]
MKVLVTGGSGKIGQWVIADLLAHGHEVINADRARPTDGPAPREAREVRFIETDVTDVGQMAGALSGCDGLIHLGAIPNPYGHADEVVFSNHVNGTFAALQAASLLGVERAVIASSLSALGTAYAPVPFAPLYAPLDEEHPLLNHDCYGLSKEVDERTALMFHRRFGMQIASLRFHWVTYLEDAAAKAERLRADPLHDDWWRLLWGYVEIRDAASICRLAIEANGIGCEAFNVTAADTLSTIPTEELLRTYTPGLELRGPIPGFDSAFSLEKGRRLLGYDPTRTWRA